MFYHNYIKSRQSMAQKSVERVGKMREDETGIRINEYQQHLFSRRNAENFPFNSHQIPNISVPLGKSVCYDFIAVIQSIHLAGDKLLHISDKTGTIYIL